MCSEEDPLSHFKRLQIGIFGFSQKETGAKSVAINNIVGVILFLITLKSLSSNYFLLHRHLK